MRLCSVYCMFIDVNVHFQLKKKKKELPDASSLPAPPRNRAACLTLGLATGEPITANGTHGVLHSQHPMDWSRSHAQWRHLAHRMRFAAGAVYMRWHLQQVMPTEHTPHEPVSWEHERTCSAWRAAIAMMGVFAPDGWGEGSGASLRMLPVTGRIPGTFAGFGGGAAWAGTRVFLMGLGALFMGPGAGVGLPLTFDRRRVLIFSAIAFSALVIFGVGAARGSSGKSAAVGGGSGRSRALTANESVWSSESR